MRTLNPDVQLAASRDPDRCFFGEAPTLAVVNVAYGSQSAAAWLTAQLYDLSEYFGCRTKLTDRALEQCAAIIAAEFYYLKVSELLLFFHRFKAMRYRRFYGAVDPGVIVESLRDFCADRAAAIAERERREDDYRREEHLKAALTWEQYRAQAGIEGGNPLDPATWQKNKSAKTQENRASCAETAANDNLYHSDRKTRQNAK